MPLSPACFLVPTRPLNTRAQPGALQRLPIPRHFLAFAQKSKVRGPASAAGQACQNRRQNFVHFAMVDVH